MIDGKKTSLEIQREKELEKSRIKWKTKIIITKTFEEGEILIVNSIFDSRKNTIDDIVHTIKLDLITMLKTKFGDKIEIEIKETK